MSWDYTIFAAILHISGIISTLVAVLASRHRRTIGAGTLALLLLAVAGWSLALGLETSVVGLENKVFFSKLEYIGSVTAPVLFLVFALEYSQQKAWLDRPVVLALFILPVSVLLAAWTNEQHHLIWTGFAFSSSQPNLLIYSHGPAFYAMLIYDYAMLLAAAGVLLQAWKRSRQPFRHQTMVLLASLLFPFLGGLLYSLNINPFPGFEATPVFFLISGALIAFDILKLQLFTLVPVAREILVENMQDGILVLDMEERIVDINPIALELIGISEPDAIGQPARQVLRSHPELVSCLNVNQAAASEIRLETQPPRILELNLTWMRGRRKNLTGRLVTFRDVTQRRLTEAALSQRNEETSIINRISLAITSGLEMNQVIRTLHEQCTHVAPIDLFYVALYDEAQALINVPVYYESGAYHPGEIRDVKEHPGMIGSVIVSQQTLYLRDTRSPLTRPVADSQKGGPQIKAYIGIPLVARKKVVGVMSIQSYMPNAYTEDQIRLLERIAVHAAIALENARLYGEVQRLAIVDELTGIYNYRGLIELGNREFERSRRFERQLSLLFFDIDNFREFNNLYSHSTGNILLRSLAATCRTVLRSVDILARFGGDEFVAILPETGTQDAQGVASRLVEEVARRKISTVHGELGVTISIGLATLNDSFSNLATLIEAANQAEREAKRNRRAVLTNGK